MGRGADKEPKRLEELLLDDTEQPVDDVNVVQEIRVVERRRGNHFTLLVMLVVFCFFALGGGYFYLQNMSLSPSTQVQHHYYASPKLPVPARHEMSAANMNTVSDQAAVDKKVEQKIVAVEDKSVKATVASKQIPLLLTVTVGPLLSHAEVEQTVEQLKRLGFQPEINRGRGLVTMIRLLEGTYPSSIARTHLTQLKKTAKSAFLLPQGDLTSVYAGSFHQQERAKNLQNDLAKQNVRVALVESDVEMNGTVLTVLQADRQTAHEVANHLSSLGLKTSIHENK